METTMFLGGVAFLKLFLATAPPQGATLPAIRNAPAVIMHVADARLPDSEIAAYEKKLSDYSFTYDIQPGADCNVLMNIDESTMPLRLKTAKPHHLATGWAMLMFPLVAKIIYNRPDRIDHCRFDQYLTYMGPKDSFHKTEHEEHLAAYSLKLSRAMANSIDWSTNPSVEDVGEDFRYHLVFKFLLSTEDH